MKEDFSRYVSHISQEEFETDMTLFLVTHLRENCSQYFKGYLLGQEFCFRETILQYNLIKSSGLRALLRTALEEYRQETELRYIPSVYPRIFQIGRAMFWKDHLENPCEFEFYGMSINQDFYLKQLINVYNKVPEEILASDLERTIKEAIKPRKRIDLFCCNNNFVSRNQNSVL